MIGNATSASILIHLTTQPGLEDALGGPANVDVGAHACVQCGKPSWDPLLFLRHVATGVQMQRPEATQILLLILS